MRLLFDGDVFCWQRYGGIARMFAEVLPRLAELDPSLELSVILPGRAASPLADHLGVPVRRVPQVPCTLRPWRLWRRVVPRMNRALAERFWRGQKADVFLSTYYTLPPVRCRTVAVVYDMVWERFADDFPPDYLRAMCGRKRAAVAAASAVICISNSTKDDVVRLLGVPSAKCRALRLAGLGSVAAERQDRLPEEAHDPFLLYVGEFRARYKNFRFMLEALGRMPASAARLPLLVVSGCAPSPSEEDEFRAALRGRVLRFVADCGDEELRALYSRCAAFVYPSLAEGFGIPLLEALECGAPVVCSRIPAFEEVGGTAVSFFDPCAGEDFAHALADAVADGRAPDAVAARRTQAARFSWDETARGFLRALRETA